ncbi:hypothetical protein OG439_27740 [Amycolatopsis sp. NBC_01307]|uniref:hypothetical protein n=1 Tax=Amycolatopsis sp. NBC_01307 TaxID=2903561 RepID=UPI002E0F5BBA|nr:hypothetical protein OG439_27740 [Amycolatopsis sp. NBC_01307]
MAAPGGEHLEGDVPQVAAADHRYTVVPAHSSGAVSADVSATGIGGTCRQSLART